MRALYIILLSRSSSSSSQAGREISEERLRGLDGPQETSHVTELLEGFGWQQLLLVPGEQLERGGGGGRH